MGKMMTIIGLLILLFCISSTIPYMMPTLRKELYLPYELWFIALLLLYGLLPAETGNFVFRLREEGN